MKYRTLDVKAVRLATSSRKEIITIITFADLGPTQMGKMKAFLQTKRPDVFAILYRDNLM